LFNCSKATSTIIALAKIAVIPAAVPTLVKLAAKPATVPAHCEKSRLLEKSVKGILISF
jgi:hypothetical protein